MAIIPLENYLDPNPVYADNDLDRFDRLHVADVALALERHDHTFHRGLPVGAISTEALASSVATVWALGVL